MVWLVLGILLWSAAHLMKSVAIPLRQGLVDRVGGEQPWRGVFSLILLAALGLIVFGWRSTIPHPAYAPPSWGDWVTQFAVFAAFILFAASGMQTNLKRWIRHPQLTGVVVWAGGHLAANGEWRSLVLFGGIGLWALVSVFTISKRDGAWEKPEPAPFLAELKLVVGATVVFLLVYLAHPYFAGVSPIAR